MSKIHKNWRNIFQTKSSNNKINAQNIVAYDNEQKVENPKKRSQLIKEEVLQLICKLKSKLNELKIVYENSSKL